MASNPPKHHMVRFGRRSDDRSCNSALAAEGWLDVKSKGWGGILLRATPIGCCRGRRA
jgi:hypothetical protein